MILLRMNLSRALSCETIKSEIADIWGVFKRYLITFIDKAKTYFSTSCIVLGLLAIINFKWAGIGILASIFSTLILLYIFYYIKQHEGMLLRNIAGFLSSILPIMITNYLLPNIEILTYVLVFIVYIYVAILVNVVIAFVLSVLLYAFITCVLGILLYELVNNYYKKGDKK